MKLISAFLLVNLSGKKPTKADVKTVLESVGAEIDEVKIDSFFALIKDRDVTEVIAAGREKMAALGSGGPAVAVVAGGDAPAAAEPVAESKKKVEEEKEESEDDGGMMSLFD